MHAETQAQGFKELVQDHTDNQGESILKPSRKPVESDFSIKLEKTIQKAPATLRTGSLIVLKGRWLMSCYLRPERREEFSLSQTHSPMPTFLSCFLFHPNSGDSIVNSKNFYLARPEGAFQATNCEQVMATLCLILGSSAHKTVRQLNITYSS